MTPMDVWASLAQVVKCTKVFTRLRPRKRKSGIITTARTPLPFLALSLLSAVVVDHRITGLAELPAKGRKDLEHWACRFLQAGGAYLWGTRRGAQPQVKSLAA